MKIKAIHHPVAQLRNISAEELAVHVKRESAWLSLDGVVYDVTTYLNFHPGGDIMLKGCGRDCRDLFCKCSTKQTSTIRG